MIKIEPIVRLSAQLARLPGVGAKTAQRLAYYLLDVPREQAEELAKSIVDAREQVFTCPVCGGYTDVVPCALCTDENRDEAQICVVQDARDVVAMEKSREFHGKYHVLQGYLSPMDGIFPEDIRIQELLDRVNAGGVKEVILATNPDVEGEATAVYIAEQLKAADVLVTRLAHGIPIGGNLEYTDEVTLARAFSGRREL
ncbi:recombination mediator RecR [Christensenellaceae bacterium OttesenSCG-928-M15]|nr:recombination mediator RecR [Christensenellaceae bacterium OttesenSCG-928-M15]